MSWLRAQLRRLQQSVMRLMSVLSRDAAGTQKLDHPLNIFGKTLLIVTVFAGVVSLTVPFFEAQLLSIKEVKALEIPRAEWHVWYGALDENCECISGEVKKALRSDLSLYQKQIHQEKVRAGSPIIFAITIPKRLISEAQTQGATEFAFGIINSSYRIWWEDQLLSKGGFSTGRFGVSIPLLSQLLHSKKETTQIYIYLKHDVKSPKPDYFLEYQRGVGFSTADEMNKARITIALWNQSRPIFFAAINLLVAILLTYFWATSTRRQEYLYMALFTLIQAGYQLNLTDINLMSMGFSKVYTLDLVFKCVESITVLLLGMAFARVREEVIGSVVAIGGFSLVFLLLGLPEDNLVKWDWYAVINKQVLPLSALLGAAICFAQGRYLVSISGTTFSHLIRVKRLYLFGSGLLIFAIFSGQYENILVLSQFTRVVSRFIHFGLVAYLSYIVLSEYVEHEKKIRKTPISIYHRRAELPEKVFGIILEIDLKNSEQLFKYGSTHGHAGVIVGRCLTEMAKVVEEFNGIVLKTEGDMVRAFFPNDKQGYAFLSVLKTVAGVRVAMNNLRILWNEKNPDFEPIPPICFRAAAGHGPIRPIWHELGGVRYPDWIEATDDGVFVKVARLLESERSLRDPGTCFLMEKTTMSEGLCLIGWKSQEVLAETKHKYVIQALVFKPQEEIKNQKTVSRAA